MILHSELFPIFLLSIGLGLKWYPWNAMEEEERPPKDDDYEDDGDERRPLLPPLPALPPADWEIV